MNRVLEAVVGVLIIGLILLAIPTMLAFAGPVPFWGRDLDCSGWVSVTEWYAGGIDFGWRPAIRGPPGCMEVFRLKDGLPEVSWCDQAPRCRRSDLLPDLSPAITRLPGSIG